MVLSIGLLPRVLLAESAKIQTILEIDGKKLMWPSFVLKDGKWGTFRKKGLALRIQAVSEGKNVRIKTQIIDTKNGKKTVLSQPGFLTRWGRTAEIYQSAVGRGKKTLRLRVRPVRLRVAKKSKRRRKKVSSRKRRAHRH